MDAYFLWCGYNICYLLLLVLLTAETLWLLLVGPAKRLSYCWAAISCWCFDEAAPDMAPDDPP